MVNNHIQPANILIIGCGDLGGAVAKRLTEESHQVTCVSRSEKVSTTIKMLSGDVTKPSTLAALSTIKPNILIYCVAADGRTDDRYKAQYVDGLRNVLATQKDNTQLKTAFFISSTRVYGQKTDTVLDDSITAIPSDFGGERLLQAEQLLASMPYPTTSLRLSGIYGPGRLRMINLAKQPNKWPEINGWSNRIHRDDAARFIVHVVNMHLQHIKLSKNYIVTDSQPCATYEVIHWLASKFGISYNSDMPHITSGKRLSNRAMLATGFKLLYPDFKSGYSTLISS